MSHSDNVRRGRALLAHIGFTEKQSATYGALVDGVRRTVVKGRLDERYVTIGDGRAWTTVKRGDANVIEEFGKPIQIGRKAGNSYLEILGMDYEREDSGPGGDGVAQDSGVPSHGRQHQMQVAWRSKPTAQQIGDPVLLPSRQLADLLIVPYAGMQLAVLSGDAIVNGTRLYFGGGLLDDMTAEIPASDEQACIARVELDSSGVLHTSFGSDYDEPVTTAAALGNAPAATGGRNTLGFVWIPNGVTTLTWYHILPAPLAERTGGAVTDEAVKVSANDTTAGYLNGKLVAGSGITLTEGSDGGDETLTVAADGVLLTTEQDWNRNGVIDNAETASLEAIGMYRRKDEPLAVMTANALATLEDMEAVGLNEDDNPVIAIGTGSDSDTHIREIGNVLYEPDATDGRKYKHFYTGYRTASTDEKIHYAYSDDGRTWTKSTSNPVISARRAEDPYVVKLDGLYYLYAEDKQSGAARIRRWHSSDCETWTDDGQVTGLGDCASPTVWIEGDTWYMLYEQINASPVWDIRLATSTDGLAFTPDGSNPVVGNGDVSWADGALVPDDILKLGSVYYMTFHAEKTNESNVYYEGLLQSTDLTTWTDVIGAEFESADYAAGRRIATASLWIDRTINILYYVASLDSSNTEPIYRGHPILADTTVLTLASDTITVSKDYHEIAAQTGVSDDLATINGGSPGQLLVLKADSGDTITVKRTGNLTLSGDQDFVLSGSQILVLLCNAAGTGWSAVGGAPEISVIRAADLATRYEPVVTEGELVFTGGDIVVVEVAN